MDDKLIIKAQIFNLEHQLLNNSFDFIDKQAIVNTIKSLKEKLK